MNLNDLLPEGGIDALATHLAYRGIKRSVAPRRCCRRF